MATGIRVEGDIQLDGGAATVSSGGRSGGLYLGTARGAATVSGTVSAVGGASVDQGGAFDGTLILGAPAVVSATFNAGGGAGNVTGGDAEDLVIMSVVGTSSVSGTVTLTAGAGATPAQNGSGGAVRVDTGALCGGGAQPLPGR